MLIQEIALLINSHVVQETVVWWGQNDTWRLHAQDWSDEDKMTLEDYTHKNGCDDDNLSRFLSSQTLYVRQQMLLYYACMQKINTFAWLRISN